MGLLDSIKNIMSIPDEDEFEDDIDENEEKDEPRARKTQESTAQRKPEPAPRVYQGSKNVKTVSFNQSQMQVVLVKPDRFEDVTSIADHLNDKKTVVLNLEVAESAVSRRIVDFLSGAAYANKGNIKKIAKNTFIIVPNGVDVAGELMLDDFEEGKMYF